MQNNRPYIEKQPDLRHYEKTMNKLTKNLYYWNKSLPWKDPPDPSRDPSGFALILERQKKIVLIDPPGLDDGEIETLKAYRFDCYLFTTRPKRTREQECIRKALNATVYHSCGPGEQPLPAALCSD